MTNAFYFHLGKLILLFTKFYFVFRHLSSELSEHEKLIDKMVSADFIKYITEDLNRPLEDTQPFLEEVRGRVDICFQILIKSNTYTHLYTATHLCNIVGWKNSSHNLNI